MTPLRRQVKAACDAIQGILIYETGPSLLNEAEGGSPEYWQWVFSEVRS
jgi:hypothetical protein